MKTTHAALEHNYLSDDKEKTYYDDTLKKQVLDARDSAKEKCHGNIFVKFAPNINEISINAGNFLTFNEQDHSIVHKVPYKK